MNPRNKTKRRHKRKRKRHRQTLENSTALAPSVLFAATTAGNSTVSPAGNAKHKRKRKRSRPPSTTCEEIKVDETLDCSPTIAPSSTSSPATSYNSPARRILKILSAMVVKVLCVHTEPNLSLPWQRKREYSSFSSGFVIEGRMIVTDARSLKHFTQVKVKKLGSNKMVEEKKYSATVLAIGDTACDIVNDDDFWEGISSVALGDLPALFRKIVVVGYHAEWDDLNLTIYPFLRMKLMSYSDLSTKLLSVQVTDIIFSGTFGGPAFNELGECVGMAIQYLGKNDSNDVGYVITTPVIRHFIHDYQKNGSYTGFPDLGVDWQKMKNPQLRQLVGMKSEQTGVRITGVDPMVLGSDVLKPSDVILSFDGVDISNNGTIPFRAGQRLNFSFLVSLKHNGDDARIKVLRDSVVHEFNIKLGTRRRLVLESINYQPPSYYIVAGLVFTVVTISYLRSEYGEDYISEAPGNLVDKCWLATSISSDEQLVVLSQVLIADVNQGYEDIVNNTPVIAFNGQRVKNLKSLAQMVESCDQELMKFDLENDQVVVLRTKAAKDATPDILDTNCIMSAMSADLKTLLGDTLSTKQNCE